MYYLAGSGRELLAVSCVHQSPQIRVSSLHYKVRLVTLRHCHCLPGDFCRSRALTAIRLDSIYFLVADEFHKINSKAVLGNQEQAAQKIQNLVKAGPQVIVDFN